MKLYLDNAATTAIDDEVLQDYIKLITCQYGSTGSLHAFGQEPLSLESAAKDKIARLLKVKSSEIYFNSGATEGNNYAIKGVALNYKNRGKTIITTKVEHPSVYYCFKQLEKDYGFNCIYLDVDENGVVDINQLKQSLNNDVILVSIMYVNHEVGSIMPIKQIGQLLKNYPKVIFHSDITQAIGKVPVDLAFVDIATMSAHKIHGIKGSGFMYKKDKVTLYELISGHPAHNALRAGTSNWPSNVVMAKALEKSLKGLAINYPKLKECQQKILTKLSDIKEITINTNALTCIPGMINFSLIGYNPEVIIRYLSNKGIYVSSRSVCSAEKKDTVSSTLFAMKKDIDVCVSSIRVSFVTPLDDNQIDYFIDSVKDAISSVRK